MPRCSQSRRYQRWQEASGTVERDGLLALPAGRYLRDDGVPESRSLHERAFALLGMPGRGFEPPPSCEDHHLKVARLPIPPPGPVCWAMRPRRAVSVARSCTKASRLHPTTAHSLQDVLAADSSGASRHQVRTLNEEAFFFLNSFLNLLLDLASSIWGCLWD